MMLIQIYYLWVPSKCMYMQVHVLDYSPSWVPCTCVYMYALQVHVLDQSPSSLGPLYMYVHVCTYMYMY